VRLAAHFASGLKSRQVFSDRSHGFRPERGSASALSVIDRAIKARYTHVVDADIQAFFDNVDHERLLAAVTEEVSDGSVLKLIRMILKAGVWLPNASELEPSELGTPQGGPLSPLLANTYLTKLDRRMVEHRLGLVRYADDFVVFARSEEEAQSALLLAQRVLSEELGLTLHPEKTRVTSVNEGFEFLGFHYFYDPKAGHCKEVRLKSVHRFRAAVRLRTPRLRTQRPVNRRHITLLRLRRNKRVIALIEDLNTYLRSWHGYFRSIQPRYGWGFENFDRFIRRRSSIVGRIGSGWWNIALSNNFLRSLGLYCLDELQSNYCWSLRRNSRLEG
jgi:RNA-directed DNA polymerase